MESRDNAVMAQARWSALVLALAIGCGSGGGGSGGRGGTGTNAGAGRGGTGGALAGAGTGGATGAAGGTTGVGGSAGMAGTSSTAGTAGLGGATGGSGGRGGGGGTAGAGGIAGAIGEGGIMGAAGTGGSGGTGGGTGGASSATAGSTGTGGTGGVVAVNEIEPNDTPATANSFTPIAVNSRVRAAIGSPGDVDYFAIFVPLGIKAIYITTFSDGVDTTCAGADTNATLFLPDGVTQIKTNDNMSATQLCSHIAVVLDGGRTLFVRVTASSPSSTFAYVLGVRFETLTAAVPETEPNEDGSPSVGNGTSTAEGNDFSIANANGPFTADTVINGAFNPAGDEDVFAIRNDGSSPAEVNLGIHYGGFGVCADNLDTQIRIRDASGTVLAFDDDAGTSGRCSFLSYVIPPATTVYAHVIDSGDDTAQTSYNLHVSFP